MCGVVVTWWRVSGDGGECRVWRVSGDGRECREMVECWVMLESVK